MDALNKEQLKAMADLTSAIEKVDITIQQDNINEQLIFNSSIGLCCTMNCRMNSVGATIRQWAYHLYKGDLLSYDSERIIGI